MLMIYRLSAWLFLAGIPMLPKLLYLLNRILFSVSLPPSAKIGRRVLFAYQGLGVVVHARAVIGDDVYIGPQVIIGGRSGEFDVPVVQDGVVLGAGCRILGPVVIERGATVGAGAVVLENVSAGETVGGVPARKIASTRRERSAS